MPVAVFDIDDTICKTINRDYVNSKPIQDVINKINIMKENGWTINLFTSRGMASCNGDIDLILSKNKSILENWLIEHNVKYDNLIFGKPLADLYVDDKAMNLYDFRNSTVDSFYGTSGGSVNRLGDTVIKTADNAKLQYEWFEYVKNNHIDINFKIPKINSLTINSLNMSYINGVVASKILDESLLYKIVNLVKSFKQIDKNKNKIDLNSYCDYLINCWDDENVKFIVNELKSDKIKKQILSNSSFSHGDFTLNNVLVSGSDLYLIDPNPKPTFSTWLADLAKIRYSLNGYDEHFNYTKLNLKLFVNYFDSLIPKEYLYCIKILEISRWIRIIPFISKNAKDSLDFVKNKIIELVEIIKHEK